MRFRTEWYDEKRVAYRDIVGTKRRWFHWHCGKRMLASRTINRAGRQILKSAYCDTCGFVKVIICTAVIGDRCPCVGHLPC